MLIKVKVRSQTVLPFQTYSRAPPIDTYRQRGKTPFFFRLLPLTEGMTKKTCQIELDINPDDKVGPSVRAQRNRPLGR